LFRVFNEYLSKVNVTTDEKLKEKMEGFFKDENKISKATINLNYNKYVIDIIMDEFTVECADVCFRKLICAVAYPYSSLWTRYNEGNHVCYRFLTSKENKNAVYMTIMFS
jgi:hypothetical protein